jgi:tripartite-type tricarboxylate transporter receptor subunit TctC
MITKRALLSLLPAVGLAPAIIAPAAAQNYPARLIRIVVPFPAGGPSDVIARLLADKLAPALGQTVLVENRPGGAGGSLGAKAVATADPDGYMLLLCPVDILTQVPLVYKNIDYDPIKSFAPIALLMTGPYVLVVNSALPVKSVAEFVAYSKANPGKISFASPGHGTYPHLMGELFKQITGAQLIHVPYRGVAPAVNDLLAGQVQMYFEAAVGVLPHIESGKLLALAVASENRTAFLPDVSTTAEAGFPQFRITYTQGLYAPPATPRGIIEKLNAAVNDALKSADIKVTFKKFAAETKGGSVQEFATLIAAAARTSADLVAAVGIKPE